MVVATVPAATPRPRRDLLYRGLVLIALATCRVMGWKVAISGEEHIPAFGPAILASNHVGNMDFVFLGLAGHRRGRLVRFVTMQEAFDHWLAGPLLRGMHHIPVDRAGDAAAGVHLAIRALEDGQVVGIHPEGRISRSLVPGPGKTGAVRMALATGAPLIPAAVWGSQRLIAPGAPVKFPRDVRVSVAIGEPLPMQPAADVDGLTSRLMERIGELWRQSAAVRAAGEDVERPPQ